MDVNTSSQVAKMKRDLLKLISVGEFSDTSLWKDPCTSFIIPEVFADLNHYVLYELCLCPKILYFLCKIIYAINYRQLYALLN